MKTRFILLCLSVALSTFDMSGQEKEHEIDVQSIFKMHLYLNALQVHANDSIYIAYSSNITLDLKKLKSNWFERDGYYFYSVDAENGIHYDGPAIFLLIGVAPVTAKEYVLCINIKNGRSYRLKGFQGNDFLDFLYDCIENGVESSVHDFLKWQEVEGLDFKFLNKALRAKKRRFMDRYKYPDILGQIGDPIIMG